MRAGFVSLGHLGRAIAGRLISQRVQLDVWNRTREKANGLGAEVADSPASLVAKVPVVFLNLTDGAAVRSVIRGKGGLVEGGCSGKVVIDTTTNHFEEVNEFHDALRGGGRGVPRIPGRRKHDSRLPGEPDVMVSGEQWAYEKALPYLEKIGKSIFYLGTPTLASKMKLINNLLLGSFMVAIAEALTLGEAAGLDKQRVLDILPAGAGNSAVLASKEAKLLSRDFSPHFSSAMMYKDLHHLQDLASALRRPLFSGSTAKELFGMSFLKGLGDQDLSAVYRVLEER